jgi:surfeit locus 1 family protein
VATPEAPRGRFPTVLTLAAAIALAILVGLGVWQLQRLKWKQGLLARIEALKTAPARPLEEALVAARAGQDVEWTRVTTDCSAQGRPQGLLYGLQDAKVVWRALAFCRDVSGAVVIADRGVLTAATGQMAPAVVAEPPPRRIVGILRQTGRGAADATPIRGGYRFSARDRSPAQQLGDRANPALAFYLVAEREDPAPMGVRPAPLPEAIPNRHLEYALTWFGLAAALSGVYLAMLLRRLRDR